MNEIDNETLAKLVLTDATEGPLADVPPMDIDYEKEGADDDGNC